MGRREGSLQSGTLENTLRLTLHMGRSTLSVLISSSTIPHRLYSRACVLISWYISSAVVLFETE